MSQLKHLRNHIKTQYHNREEDVVESLLDHAYVHKIDHAQVSDVAEDLVIKSREKLKKASLADTMLYTYKLSSKEGLSLMCMAEALLRIPDKETAQKLIEDQLKDADWSKYNSDSSSALFSLANFALNMTGKLIDTSEQNSLMSKPRKALKSLSAPLIRQSVKQSMAILSQKFVIGETIEKATKNARKDETKGYTHSYDMLGEAAYTQDDAQRYFESYSHAISIIGVTSAEGDICEKPDISVKLSALHPRYEYAQQNRVMTELYERLKTLCVEAKSHDIALGIDAEEAARLELSIDLFEKLLKDPDLVGWDGLSFVVQAYQKRALDVIKWLDEASKEYKRNIRVRLVKGAYWDTEIKIAQEEGVEDFPVFTQKSSTDLSYLVCGDALLAAENIYPMFATHNAHTIAALAEMGKGKKFEFQKLFGMGDELYNSYLESEATKVRIYAPVGTHKDLLPYLVRRLLENGANSSFVNHIADSSIDPSTLIKDPLEKVRSNKSKRHPDIPLPKDLFAPKRSNSKGLNFSDPLQVDGLTLCDPEALTKELSFSLTSSEKDEPYKVSLNPLDQTQLGRYEEFTEAHVDQLVNTSLNAFKTWSVTSPEERSIILDTASDLLEVHRDEFISLCVYEAGKTLPDAVAEIREAVDFCRYYAQQAREKLSSPIKLPGPFGEHNHLHYRSRGPVVCISPWNFPLAIFLGQITAALAAGNTVLAKPAGETVLIAKKAIDILIQAGLPEYVVQLTPGAGSSLGQALINHPDIQAVAVTGSTETAWQINKTLANKRGPIIPLIAETGGQNAMIVDSSALPEQVVADVISSAFQSAGQRCSALRVLYVQEEIAERVIEVLKGAMEELVIGDPSQLSTDVGPVISLNAAQGLNDHLKTLGEIGNEIFTCKLDPNLKGECFVAPSVYEIKSISQLETENFGPILHIIRFKKEGLDTVLDDINASRFGLTFGLHTRLHGLVDQVREKIKAGNVYINRNTIGAIVGSQPFGGMGLSGTGPKAGGPTYLLRFCHEQTVSNNIMAQGGDRTLLGLQDF